MKRCQTVRTERSPLRIVLLGKTGTGKSSAGNIILGKAAFETSSSNNTWTTECQSAEGEVCGRIVTVIDTPDLTDTVLTQESMREEIISLCAPGPHAFLLVMSSEEFTEEESRVRFFLKKIFGENSMNYTMILFTHADINRYPQDEAMLQISEASQEFMKEIHSRYHVFNNNNLIDHNQVPQLLQKIEEMVEWNGGFYTDENTKKLPPSDVTPAPKGSVTERTSLLPSITHRSPEPELTMPPSQQDVSTINKVKKSDDTPGDKILQEIIRRVGLERFYPQKLSTAEVMVVNRSSLQQQKPQTEKDLGITFLQKLLALDYRAREFTIKEENIGPRKHSTDLMSFIEQKKKQEHKQAGVHPLDVQMAVFHCADNFLRQYMMTKLSISQYALPLLVPNPVTADIEFPLWTFRQIKKSWKSLDPSEETITRSIPVYKAYTTMVPFFRIGTAPYSKSQLLSFLINPRHNTFFHRHCPSSSRNRLLMDGVVEIAWYCPSGEPDDTFRDCVTFCNLHGDAEEHERQRTFLINSASVSVILLQGFDIDEKGYEIIPRIFEVSKPLIFLLSKEETGLTGMGGDHYKIGLKDRNQAEIIEELTLAISHFLKDSSPTFNLEDMARLFEFSTDEDDKDCQRGKSQAQDIHKQMEGVEFSQIKSKLLPSQGTPWHKWCEKSKDLCRLHGNVTHMESEIHSAMKSLRREQRDFALSGLMKSFLRALQSGNGTQNMYFLKWLGYIMDDHCEDRLSVFHKAYHTKWTEVLKLKNEHNKSEELGTKQEELEQLSQQLSDSTCGLEHIMREMGQVYEAWEFQPKGLREEGIENISCLPALAADIMISGNPVELMDGDAAHVPVEWVDSVLGKVSEKLGNPRVFVLSVLGLQSTGKSTMLNAMFGLQFAVSAGRCTRGAFMQLVKVAEDIKAESGIDYILVIDTEGLRAIELAGKATVHHDNELATFVIGLGSMTLINIFGENPAEIQDTLQIVIQAFLRMKKVKLSPSCIFVHQNVADIAAGERTMEGKRHLQENLDEMTRLAAKEEECDADCFSDVISFDVMKHIQYFAQLWEGNPPMAPPNPRYSENVQQLKNIMLSVAKQKKVLKISELSVHVKDLWKALVNENFVFSFKNTLEIVAYRKLEVEYGNWTWPLRSSMQATENSLHIRIENGSLKTVDKEYLRQEIKSAYDTVMAKMNKYFSDDESADILAQWSSRIMIRIADLQEELIDGTKRKLDEIIQQKAACKEFDDKRTNYENILYNRSQELAFKLKQGSHNEEKMKKEFDSMWELWEKEMEAKMPPIKEINIEQDIWDILKPYFNEKLIHSHLKKYNSKNIPLQNSSATAKQFDFTGFLKKGFNLIGFPFSVKAVDEIKVREMSQKIVHGTEEYIKNVPIKKMGYNKSYIQKIVNYVINEISIFESNNPALKREFKLDLLMYVCHMAEETFTTFQQQFRDANDPRMYLNSKKPEYYNIFKMHCKDTASAVVLADILCSKLKPCILQAVYDKTANDAAGKIRADFPEFSGNRSNLEKHFLTTLAEELDFEKFIKYVNEPKKYFEDFITESVYSQFFGNGNPSVLKIFKENLMQKLHCVTKAVETATQHVKNCRNEDDKVGLWLNSFSEDLEDKVKFRVADLQGIEVGDIRDFDGLEKAFKKTLETITQELNSGFSSLSSIKMEIFRERPDQLLIKQLCDCCWASCPFCAAICTHSMKDHPGDHSVPFHRPSAVNGWKYYDTRYFSLLICTTVISSDCEFHPDSSDRTVPYKKYREGGDRFASWSITPDNSELPYWKWILCQFKADLESHYKLSFQERGEIPEAWKKITKEEAFESLDRYYLNK